MTTICLLVGTQQAIARKDIVSCNSAHAAITFMTSQWSDVTADMIKHVSYLIVLDIQTNDLQLQALAERNKLHFNRTLALYAEANKHSPINETINKWLEAQLSRPQKQVRDIDHLVGTWKSDLLSHHKTDHFQERTIQFGENAALLSHARAKGKQSVISAINSFSNMNTQTLTTIVDAYLSLRSIKCYQEMCDLYESLHPILQALDLLKEQYVFAKNRLAKTIQEKEELIEILESIEQPSSETLAIKGRIYKDCWQISSNNNKFKYLNNTIESYQHASYLDTRDNYPAINYATFLRIRSEDGDIAEMRSVLDCMLYNLKVSTTLFDKELPANVTPSQSPNKRVFDYWDVATVLEIYVLRQHQEKAWSFVESLIAYCNESWMLETTINNLVIIDKYVKSAPFWLKDLIQALRSESANKENL